MQDYFQAVADIFFIDCVSCVAAFCWNKHDSAIRFTSSYSLPCVLSFYTLFPPRLPSSRKSIELMHWTSWHPLFLFFSTFLPPYSDLPLHSQKSIAWLDFCATQLYTGKVEQLPLPNSDGVIFTNSDRHTSLWFPILTGLGKTTQHKDVTIRLRYSLFSLVSVANVLRK